VSWGRRAALTLALLCIASAPHVVAQDAPDAPRVSLITVGPGPLYWESFGHNMIRVIDPVLGTDLAYNFGIFDWADKNFLWNFIQGRPMYSLQAWLGAGSLEFYERTGRSIEVQDLALSPEQARLLADNLARNAEPDQRAYRYDYYRDNCSTRVRDALNLALGGKLERDLTHVPTQSTYRSQTALLTSRNPALYFGLMLLLGPATDRPLSAWEEAFVPMAFARYLAPETTQDASGASVALVRRSTMLPERSAQGGRPHSPASLLRWFLVLGVALGGALAWAGQWRRAFVVLGGLWSLLSGLAGFVMVYLWAFTDHVVAYRNENMLQASILGLALFAALAGWARRGDGPPSRTVVTLAAAIAALSVVGIALKIVPGPIQVNGVVLAFFVPANLGMALGAIRAATVTTGPTEALPSRP
jgi:hypothetical protein